uniref:Uncharacterized protein n=1 Tax=Magnetococcus massalia (strain MO-1) TaxID=451514 RepID=A0A1S7LFH3_MAGMO|nr:Conserved protein of unknown function [Candidatus Magnetococcus massalia]
MMATKKSSLSWKDLKSEICYFNQNDLIKLIGELYALNKENKHYLEAKFDSSPRRLEPYKKIIEEAVYPDVYKNKPIRISVGKKAISDYKKSRPDDLVGHLELMVHFVELANRFTVNFGDIDAGFYTSVERMFEKVTEILKKCPSEIQDEYIPRLEDVDSSANGIGWGYPDTISSLLDGLFAHINREE